MHLQRLRESEGFCSNRSLTDRSITRRRGHEHERSQQKKIHDGASFTAELSWSGSLALATVALTTLTADAQTQASTRKGEQDHSSSDPGQENKGLLASACFITATICSTEKRFFFMANPSAFLRLGFAED